MTAKPLRRVLDIELLTAEFKVDVDFRLIEVLERAFGMSADALVDIFLQRMRVQRRHVADVLAEILPRAGATQTRTEIREAVITLDLEAFAVLVSQLQAALLFIIKHMTPEEFDKVSSELDSTKKKLVTPSATAS
jgi:hypothetical protein